VADDSAGVGELWQGFFPAGVDSGSAQLALEQLYRRY
jgi:hypothetical protein